VPLVGWNRVFWRVSKKQGDFFDHLKNDEEERVVARTSHFCSSAQRLDLLSEGEINIVKVFWYFRSQGRALISPHCLQTSVNVMVCASLCADIKWRHTII
jgi:hypothetical protein